MRIPRAALLAVAAAALALPRAGHAAPTLVAAVLRVGIQGLAPVTISSSGTVSVAGSVVTVPAGLVSQLGALTIPVTGTSGIASVVGTGIANLSGTFSLGGITAQAPGEVCGTGPLSGQACNVGGGLGGLMGITGFVAVHVVPHVVVVPINLNAAGIGQGGSTASPFTFDAAGWTSRTGRIGTPSGPLATTGSSSPLVLVTPTFVAACGSLLPIFASLSLTALPVPEPVLGALLALAAALALQLRSPR